VPLPAAPADCPANASYAEALGWLQTLRAIDEALPDEYELKRAAWSKLLDAGTQRVD
jgi:hypothetical protein